MKKRNTMYLRIVGYIKGYMVLEHVSAAEMAKSGHMALSTFYERLRKPEDMRLDELAGIARKMGVTIGEMMGE